MSEGKCLVPSIFVIAAYLSRALQHLSSNSIGGLGKGSSPQESDMVELADCDTGRVAYGIAML